MHSQNRCVVFYEKCVTFDTSAQAKTTHQPRECVILSRNFEKKGILSNFYQRISKLVKNNYIYLRNTLIVTLLETFFNNPLFAVHVNSLPLSSALARITSSDLK